MKGEETRESVIARAEQLIGRMRRKLERLTVVMRAGELNVLNEEHRASWEDIEDLTDTIARLTAREQQGWQAVTRLEVIDDETGRLFTWWNTRVEPSFQDDGRTLKLFLTRSTSSSSREE